MRIRHSRRIRLMFMVYFSAVTHCQVQAHPLSPALLELDFRPVPARARWKQPLQLPIGTHLEPRLPEPCTPRPVADLEALGNSHQRSWILACASTELSGLELGVSGLEPGSTQALLRVVWPESTGRVPLEVLLTPEQPTWTITAPTELQSPLWMNLQQGLAHLLRGPDHLLFVVGMCLLLGGLRSILLVLSAFTVGHALTLTLCGLGLITLPSGPVELGIALTLVWLACELASKAQADTRTVGPERTRRRAPDPPMQAPPERIQLKRALHIHPMSGICLAFGLVHGAGFAGGFSALGMRGAALLPMMAGFNLGVELAQGLVAGLTLAVYALVSARFSRLKASLTRLVAYVIGSVAVLWCLERL